MAVAASEGRFAGHAGVVVCVPRLVVPKTFQLFEGPEEVLPWLMELPL